MRKDKKPFNTKLIVGLKGSKHAKGRIAALLAVLQSDLSVEEASTWLHITPATFRKLRRRAMQAMLEELEPRTRGRPLLAPTYEKMRISELEEEVEDLRARLWTAKIREEVLMTMPRILVKSGKRKKK